MSVTTLIKKVINTAAGNGDVIIDDSAFDKAISDYADLAEELASLRSDIEELLTTLKTGFDTPAGRLFISSCENNLLEPLDQQKAVIDEVISTLSDVKGEYSSVFTEYEELNSSISSYQA